MSVEWDWIVPSCPILGPIAVVLALWVKRETAEKKYWRGKAIGYLESLGETVEVAGDLVEDDRE